MVQSKVHDPMIHDSIGLGGKSFSQRGSFEGCRPPFFLAFSLRKSWKFRICSFGLGWSHSKHLWFFNSVAVYSLQSHFFQCVCTWCGTMEKEKKNYRMTELQLSEPFWRLFFFHHVQTIGTYGSMQ